MLYLNKKFINWLTYETSLGYFVRTTYEEADKQEKLLKEQEKFDAFAEELKLPEAPKYIPESWKYQ